MTPQLVEEILHAVADLRVPKTDGVIIYALKIPADIFKQGGVRCGHYKKMVQREIDNHPAIPDVLVRWTVYGECMLQRAR
jgi:hypothetical protein